MPCLVMTGTRAALHVPASVGCIGGLDSTALDRYISLTLTPSVPSSHERSPRGPPEAGVRRPLSRTSARRLVLRRVAVRSPVCANAVRRHGERDCLHFERSTLRVPWRTSPRLSRGIRRGVCIRAAKALQGVRCCLTIGKSAAAPHVGARTNLRSLSASRGCRPLGASHRPACRLHLEVRRLGTSSPGCRALPAWWPPPARQLPRSRGYIRPDPRRRSRAGPRAAAQVA
jgi:hypothetical protein